MAVKGNTGVESSITQQEIRKMGVFKGICHFHTEKSEVNAPIPAIVDLALEYGYQFLVPTDYNSAEGGPAIREYVESQGLDIVVINGEEMTGTQWHTVGWGLNETISETLPGMNNPIERIEAFHEQGSPIFRLTISTD